MKNKKSQIEMIVGFVIPFVLLMVVWLGVKVALAVGFGPLEKVQASVKITDSGTTSACDYWLINFLRAKAQNDVAYSDVLAQASDNSQKKELFDTKAQDYFKNNYRRGIGITNVHWSLNAETSAHQQITNIGDAKAFLKRSCAQKIPSEKGPIIVTLGVDY